MISLALDDHHAIVTLCRPPVNAINEEWLTALDEAISQIESHSEIGVVWIRSSERLFSAGADLGLMRDRFSTEAGRDLMISFVRRIQRVYARLEALGAVSIAEINGAAMGGGLELALACDLRVIAEEAKVGLPEARLGLLPGAGGTQRLTRRCGDPVARRLILGAEIIDGLTAAELGLADWSVPGTGIESFTRSLVERIANLPTHALAACKTCIDSAHESSDRGFERELAGTLNLLASEKTQYLVSRFLDRDKSETKEADEPRIGMSARKSVAQTT